MNMGVLSPNMAGFAAQQEFFLNLLNNELTLDAVMQLYLVSHGVHRFILGQSDIFCWTNLLVWRDSYFPMDPNSF